jgi:hypothetical protein
MDDVNVKSWWKSKTIIGLIVIAVCFAASLFHHPLDDQQKADLRGLLEVSGIILGMYMASHGRVTATRQIGKKPSPPARMIPLIMVAALLFLGGCAKDTPTTLYGRSLGISAALHDTAHVYHVTAKAMAKGQGSLVPSTQPGGYANDPCPSIADRYAVEQQMDLILQADQAIVDSLHADYYAYEAALAAGNDAEASSINSRAHITFDAIHALATRMTALAAKSRDSP